MTEETPEEPQGPFVHIIGLTVQGEGKEEHSYEFCSIHEPMLHALKDFIHDLHQNDIFLPRDIFISVLNDMDCVVFEADERDKKDMTFETITKEIGDNPPSLASSIEKLRNALKAEHHNLSEKTSRKLELHLDAHLSEELHDAFTETRQAKKVQPDKKKDKLQKRERGSPATIHIGKHKSGKEALKIVKRAAMYYDSQIPDSAKSGGYEFISNIPTFLMAGDVGSAINFYSSQFFSADNPLLNLSNSDYFTLGSAAGGGGLVTTFAGESGLNALRRGTCIDILADFEINKQEKGEEKAYKILEEDTHKHGLLFENIPRQNLRQYPNERFSRLIASRMRFKKNGHLKQRILDVSDCLRNHKLETAKKIPAKALSGLVGIFRTAGALFGRLAEDTISNPFKGQIWKDIGKGIPAVKKLGLNFHIIRSGSRYKIKQRAYFVDITKGKHDDSELVKTNPSFIAEARDTRQSLKKTIRGAKFEGFRYGLETLFVGGHVASAIGVLYHGIKHFDGQSITDSFDFLKLAINAGSISLALEPFAHLGRNVDRLVEKATGDRAVEAQQYERMEELAIRLKRNKAEIGVEPEEPQP